MNEHIQAMTTVANRSDAEMIARTLVEERLAACVQIVGPITSVYRWQGKIEGAEEWQCLIKTQAKLFEAVKTAVRRVHPYETPEIIATTIAGGNPEYLLWLDEQVGGE